MGKTTKTEPERLDPFTVSGSGDAAKRELQAQLTAHKRRTAKRRPRASYDLPAAMIEAVQDAAKAERVSQSDIVGYALAEWLDRYQAGAVDLSEHKQPSRSPRYDLTLTLPGDW